MKVESQVLEIPVDANFNAAVQKIANDGWTILPGAKAIFPVSRTVNDDGSVASAQPASNPAAALLAQQMPELQVGFRDDEVYILKPDGRLLDASNNEVNAEERHRRWQASESARREHAIRQLREEGVPEDQIEHELARMKRDLGEAA